MRYLTPNGFVLRLLGAFGIVATLMSAPPAVGAIIYHSAVATVEAWPTHNERRFYGIETGAPWFELYATAGPNGITFLSITGSGHPDFTGAPGAPNIYFSTLGATTMLERYAAGSQVDAFSGANLAYVAIAQNPTLQPGSWPVAPEEERFIGFKADQNGDSFYGWIGVKFTAHKYWLGNDNTIALEITGYAYEDQPGMAVLTGDSGDGLALPTPSTATLLAPLLGIGVLLTRRKSSVPRFLRAKRRL